MSQIVPVPSNGALPLGKNRNPLGVWFLNIITCGIYHLYWVYKVNSEIAAHDPEIEVNAGRSVLAQFVPIANLVSLYNTAGRLQRMEMADHAEKPVSPILCIVLYVAYHLMVQGHLNRHWDAHRSHLAASHLAPAYSPAASTHAATTDRSSNQVPAAAGREASRPDE